MPVFDLIYKVSTVLLIQPLTFTEMSHARQLAYKNTLQQTWRKSM